MNILVNDTGFHPLPATPDTDEVLQITPDCAPDLAALDLNAYGQISITFADFADGRGFGLARTLRDLGYQGHLRAVGYLIADQYAMARRAGFDDIEISPDLATRQPQQHWRARANWQDHDHRSRLFA